jgi:hypothetical protein
LGSIEISTVVFQKGSSKKRLSSAAERLLDLNPRPVISSVRDGGIVCKLNGVKVSQIKEIISNIFIDADHPPGNRVFLYVREDREGDSGSKGRRFEFSQARQVDFPS